MHEMRYYNHSLNKSIGEMTKEYYPNDDKKTNEIISNTNNKINDEVKRIFEQMDNANKNTSSFLNDFHFLTDGNLDYMNNMKINELDIFCKNPNYMKSFLEAKFEKYPNLFEPNTPKDEIPNAVANKFYSLNKIFTNSIEQNKIQNEIESNIGSDLEKNISVSINMATSTDGLKSKNEIEKFAKFLQVGQEFKGDDAKAVFQTLKAMDKALMDTNNKDFKHLYEKIGLKFKDINGKEIKINAKLGEGWFQKDLNHLVNLGSNDCSFTPSKIANKMFIKATELEKAEPNKDKSIEKEKSKFKFKNLLPQNAFDKVINGGVNTIAMIAESTGDESMQQFAQSFTRIASMGQSKDRAIPSKEKDSSFSQDILNFIGGSHKKLVENGEITKPKEKTKEFMHPKDVGMVL